MPPLKVDIHIEDAKAKGERLLWVGLGCWSTQGTQPLWAEASNIIYYCYYKLPFNTIIKHKLN